MQLNPLAYGVPFKVSRVSCASIIHSFSSIHIIIHSRAFHIVYVFQQEGGLLEFIRDLIHTKALKLDLFRMIRYNEKEGTLFPTDRGRTASHYYIKCDTMEVSTTLVHSQFDWIDSTLRMCIQIVNDSLREFMTEADILALISSSTEFEQLKVFLC